MTGFRRFILRSLLIALTPMALLLAIYVALDPFKVVRTYDQYYPDPPSFQPWINQSTITVNTWERQRHQRHYNAFVLGSSLSGHIPVDAWRPHLPPDAQPFHFYSSWEGVESILHSLEKLERDSADLRHALVMLSHVVFNREYAFAPAEVSHPEISPTLSRWRYHWVFLSGFYNRDFLRSYIAGQLLRQPLKVNGTVGCTWQDAWVDTVTNEMLHPLAERAIRQNPSQYRQEHFWKEPLPPGHYRRHPRYITPRHEAMLRRIAAIFDAHATDYHIVIPPSNSRDVCHPADMALLRDIFGDHLHDFSRSMMWTSYHDTLWFDDIHYTRTIPAWLLDSIYPH